MAIPIHYHDDCMLIDSQPNRGTWNQIEAPELATRLVVVR